MIDIGEDLVGAYLREVVGCPLVNFNVRTGVAQGEIDVVAMKVDGVRITEVWLCEVSTHTGGLGGYRGDAPNKIRKKVERVRAYAETTYPGARHHIEVWSPKVTPSMQAKVTAVLENYPDVRLVANAEYAARVQSLASLARKATAYSDSPSFRLLQVLTRLPGNPLG